MSCPGLLLKTTSGRDICIRLYLEDVSWRLGPDPDPEGPQPIPWRQIDDIRILATVNIGIANISDERLRGPLTLAIQAALKEVAHRLPQGVTIGDGLLNARTRSVA